MSDKLEERAPPVALCPAFTFNAPTDPDDMSIYIRTVSSKSRFAVRKAKKKKSS